jgi:hypothetical protein
MSDLIPNDYIKLRLRSKSEFASRNMLRCALSIKS